MFGYTFFRIHVCICMHSFDMIVCVYDVCLNSSSAKKPKMTMFFLSQTASNLGYAKVYVSIYSTPQLSGQQRVLVECVTFRKPGRNAVDASGMRFCIDFSGVGKLGKELGS